MNPQSLLYSVINGDLPPSKAGLLLGWRFISHDPAQDQINVEFDASTALTNPMGNIQGGFLAAMLDDTMGPALVATLEPGEFAPTLELKVNFLRPARPGRLIGTGRVVHRGGTVAFLAGDLSDVGGNLLATATATARIVRAA